ncbi:MAG TPA: protein kinase [Gemmatimonadales bacterium]|nr:protein kinase [Gemmatimonadales bacterium]
MSTPSPDLFATLQRALGATYRLERELGRGGMGVVFQAVDTTLDRVVAVKVVHPELAAHSAIAQRFLAEARMIARLRHPNIVAVHSAGNADGLLWYVMDEVPGESLRQRLLREGTIPPAEVARIVSDLAQALDAAARAGVVHRDLKPENVLLDSASGRAMLADFGIARAMIGDGTGPTTGVGVAIGTPAYMSPEQAAGEEVDHRSDLYSLGIVAWEMLAGRPPFEGPGRIVVSKHLAERPTPIEQVRADTPAPLAAAIARALEKLPTDRWQSGEEFRLAALGERPVPPRTTPDGLPAAAADTLALPAARRGGPRRWPRLAGLAAAVAILLGGGVAVATRQAARVPPGVNPRHSILVLPFTNVREDARVEWLRDASVSMLGLNLSQWNDLTVVDHARLHDLFAKHDLKVGDDVGLDMARRLARDAGVWTIVVGEYTQAGDSLHLVARLYDVATGARIETAQVDGAPGDDVRPLFDQLAARLLDLSGAPTGTASNLAQATTANLEAFRAYLAGMEHLNRWDLVSAERSFRQATTMDSTFGLAYYKLALARGWLVGLPDSLSDHAMVRAAANSTRLPLHERTVIRAYDAFIRQQYADARALYQQLLARDSTDVDAWYGLGEAWFHDGTNKQNEIAHWSQALRAFRRTLALDPEYALAYDHVNMMYTMTARPGAPVALVAADSFARALDTAGRPRLEPAVRTAAARRASAAAVALARGWVSAQPTTARAHAALVDAYVAAGDYDGALAEVGRFRQVAPARAEHPFVEARIRFAAGQVDEAARTLRAALDTVGAQDFGTTDETPTVLDDLAAAANVFAYQGDLTNAARAIDLTDQVRRAVFRDIHAQGGGPMSELWRRRALGELYAAAGAPAASLRRVWESAAEASRSAPPPQKKELAYTGATAAVGLLAGVPADPSALDELHALTGDVPPREVRALAALARRDSSGARRIMAEPDTANAMLSYTVYRRPIAAQVYFLLGDYERTLAALEPYTPDAINGHGFDPRWGILGRVRLLRGLAYERLGHVAEAREEYRQALAQWQQHADPALEPFVRSAQQGIGRVTGQG